MKENKIYMLEINDEQQGKIEELLKMFSIEYKKLDCNLIAQFSDGGYIKVDNGDLKKWTIDILDR